MQKSNSQKVAKEVIKFEISALRKLSKSINQSLSNIIQLILKCKNEWCKIYTGEFKGWLQKKSLWGLL